MRKVFNFNAGPSMLPEEIMEQAQAEFLDWHGTGMSIMELGHRGPEFQALAKQSQQDLRELMGIPDNYEVLFLTGGASAQFAMVPLNLLRQKGSKADYVETGIWSKKAIAEASRYGDIQTVAATQQRDGLVSVPPISEWSVREDSDYLHYTPNETIAGIEFHWVPECGDKPLVADMSSMILSREIDVTQFGVIYAGAQKNIGQAGLTIVIIRKDLIRGSDFLIPSLYSYALQAEHQSFYNTPPTYAWYIAGLVLAWMKKKGGVAYFAALNKRKANKLYAYLDLHREFYLTTVHPDSRSRMNVVFNLLNENLTQQFLQESTEAGLTNLRGHKVAGGVRASLYNAMPEEGVDALLEFMDDFRKKNV